MNKSTIELTPYQQHKRAFKGLNVGTQAALNLMWGERAWIDGEKFVLKRYDIDFFVFLFRQYAPEQKNIFTITCFDKSGNKICKSFDHNEKTLLNALKEVRDGSLEAG